MQFITDHSHHVLCEEIWLRAYLSALEHDAVESAIQTAKRAVDGYLSWVTTIDSQMREIEASNQLRNSAQRYGGEEFIRDMERFESLTGDGSEV